MKRKRKEEENARLKAAMQMKNGMDCDSGIECREVVDMRIDSLPARNIDEPQVTSSVEEDKKTMQVEGIKSCSLENFRQGCCNGNSCSNGSCSSSSSAIVAKPSSQRIEVCMGSKCKKFGAATLLEEFERKVSVGGAVVGCKCMGKCKDGPNVRVLNHCNNDNRDEQRRRHPTNPLCIGVGLDETHTGSTHAGSKDGSKYGSVRIELGNVEKKEDGNAAQIQSSAQ